VAVAAGEKAVQYQTGAQWLAVVLLGTAFIVAVCAAGGAVWGAVATTVAAALYERRLARRDEALERLGMLPPSARHARPMPDPLRVECDEYWCAARQAAVEAEQPTQPQPTVPLPPLDDTVVMDGAAAWDDTWFRPAGIGGGR
jgi:hypothetical protein